MIKYKYYFPDLIVLLLIFLFYQNLKSQQKLIITGIPKGDGRPILAKISDYVSDSKFHFYSFTNLKNLDPKESLKDLNGDDLLGYGNEGLIGEDYLKYSGKNSDIEYSIQAGISAVYDFMLFDFPGGAQSTKYLFGAGYYDMCSLISVIIPTNLTDYKLRSGITVGYKFRETSNFSAYDLNYTDFGAIKNSFKDRKGIQGGGFFVNLSVQMDLREMQQELAPILAFSFDNVMGSMSESKNNINDISGEYYLMDIKDPYRANFGFQISPMRYLDIRMDILRMNETPEYRIEISKEFANVELSAYIIQKEHTVFNDIRDSYHFMFGLKTEKNESYLKLYLSYDNRKYFGLGIGFVI